MCVYLNIIFNAYRFRFILLCSEIFFRRQTVANENFIIRILHFSSSSPSLMPSYRKLSRGESWGEMRRRRDELNLYDCLILKETQTMRRPFDAIRIMSTE